MGIPDALHRLVHDPAGPELIAIRVRNDAPLDNSHDSMPRGALFLLTEGLVAVQTDRGRVIAGPRSIGWMPPGQAHTVQSFGPTAGVGVFLAARHCSALPPHPAQFEASALASLLMQRMLEWAPEAPLEPPQRRMLQVLLDELGQAGTQSLQLPWPKDERLLSVARALLANPASGRRLEQWARFADISARTLSRKFVEETGMSFGQWRQWARLTQALEWLATGQAVKHVALSLGYDSVSAFIKAFRLALGTTPSAYFGAGRRNAAARDAEPVPELSPTQLSGELDAL